MKVIEEDVIACILPLPDTNTLNQLIKGIQEVKNVGTESDICRLLINRVCRNIKKNHPDIVIAAVSEANPLISDKPPKETKNMLSDKFNPVFNCSNICLYVVNSEKGREFIRSITKKDTLTQYV